MLEHYKYFVQEKLTRDPSCYGTFLYVDNLFEGTYFVSPLVYDRLAKAGNTKLIKALLC
jgi:hypothetical protein